MESSAVGKHEQLSFTQGKYVEERKEEFEEDEKKCCMVIDPMTSSWLGEWDLLIALSILYTALVTPVEVGFTSSTSFTWFFWVNQVVNAIFIVDMLLQFFTAYQLPNEDWVYDERKIVEHYLSGPFVVDFVASFPYDLVAMAFEESWVTDVSAARLFRLVRLLKLLRLMRSSKLLRKYRADMTLSYGSLNVLFFVFISIMTCHWIACAWGFVGNAAENRENSWLGQFIDGDNEWSINPPKNQYLVSLYMSVMTLTTVGYGDLNPKNLAEYALLVVCMLIGGYMWAYIIGAVCGTLANLDLVKIRHQQRFDQINCLLVNMCIPYKIAHQVRSYCLQSEEVDRHVAYKTLVDYLSPQLQYAVCSELVKSTIAYVPYFTRRSQAFQNALYKKLDSRLYCPDEAIKEPELIIVVNHGCIKTGFKMCYRGDALNLDFVLKYLPRPRRSMQSHKYTEVNILSREDLEKVCDAFPRDRVHILWMRTLFAFRIAAESADPETRGALPAKKLEEPKEALAAAHRGDLWNCADKFTDSRFMVEIAIEASNGRAFRDASQRLRADPDVVDLALKCAGGDEFRDVVFPHIEDPLRRTLQRLAALLKCDISPTKTTAAKPQLLNSFSMASRKSPTGASAAKGFW